MNGKVNPIYEEITSIASNLTPQNMAYALNTLNTLLFCQQIAKQQNPTNSPTATDKDK